MASSPFRVGGIVLCGGRSARMGRPKAWLPFGEEALLPRVVRLLGEVVNPIVVVAAANQALPPMPTSVTIVRDEEKDRGPLHGLAIGLKALRGSVDAAYVTSCDAPFLKPDFVRRMIELTGDFAICVPRTQKLHHPLAAVYRLHVADSAEQLLRENRSRLIDLLQEEPARTVAASEWIDVDPLLQSLRNVNTPEEYEEATRTPVSP